MNNLNASVRGTLAGEGLTEPNLYFRPFRGENANESPTGHQKKRQASRLGDFSVKFALRASEIAFGSEILLRNVKYAGACDWDVACWTM